MKEKDSVENNEKSPDNRKKSGEKIISDNKTISANGKAFAGESRENKMGVMSEGKLLMSMSLPMIISMLFQAMYNVCVKIQHGRTYGCVHGISDTESDDRSFLGTGSWL